MKKLSILILGAILLLSGILLANAKDNLTSRIIKKDVDLHNVAGNYTYITGAANRSGEWEQGEMCDFNNDMEINIADVDRFNVHCSVINGRDSNKCDLNKDGEFNIADINVFNYTCLNGILGNNNEEQEEEGEMCDFNKDKEINIADVDRFNVHCSVINGRDSNKCDLNKDGEFNIADINVFNYTCLNGILGNNNEEQEEEGEMCDFDDDGNVNISDITRYIERCYNGKGSDSKKCDLNSNGRFDADDMTKFIDKCFNGLLGNTDTEEPEEEGEICDFNNDNEINIADLSRYNKHCNISNGGDSNKCDLNDDGEFNIADINLFNQMCKNKVNGVNSEGTTQNGNNLVSILDVGYNAESVNAYSWAYNNGITTMSTIEDAQLKGKLTRIATAKMISKFAINVLGIQPDTSNGKAKFKDITENLDKKYDRGVTQAYQLGIMGINVENFRPDDPITRAEVATILSRLLFNTEDGKGNKKYYETHVQVLKNYGIMKDDGLSSLIKPITRGDTMVMLYRAGTK